MQQLKPKIVYKMDYAIKMKILGHNLLTTMPNPVEPTYKCFIFEDDPTFDADLHSIIIEGRKNHVEH